MAIRFADHLKDIPEYVPGKPVEELERELGITGAVKMASNENFLGPPQKVIAAISEKIRSLNLYPDSGCFVLRETLGKKFGVSREQVIVGNGSNYLIELICRSVLNPGDEGITCDPSFLFYRRAIRGAIGVHKSIPLKGFEVDIEALLNSVSDRTRLILLGSPNNPTGRPLPISNLKVLMNRLDPSTLVVLDEAYIDFTQSPGFQSGLDLLKDHPNLIVLRTFSKIYSLAGLRIGYGISHAAIIQGLMKLYLPFNVGTLAQTAAFASLEKEDLDEIRRINEEGKGYLYKELNRLGLDFVPTEANFILIRVGEATRVYEGLLKRGVIARDMTPWKLPEHIRVTISQPENNERFIRELHAILGS
jgi:histidinol-phosphate aminotransferase